MKIFAASLALSLLLISQLAFAQCPPAGFPNPGYTCATAPLLCPTLDGYCVNTGIAPPIIPPVPIPGCPVGNVLNNPIWFAFFAGTTTITMNLTATGCMGNDDGIQAGIYDNCISQPLALKCNCNTSANNFTLTSSNFVVGEVYYIFIDGCDGADCNISIDVTAGTTEQSPPNDPGPINGPVTVCAGTNSNYNIAPVAGATQFNWTIDPPSGGTITGNNLNATVNWSNAAAGDYEVCVDVANQCLPNDNPSCKTVTVIPRPTATISGTGILCAGANPPPVELTISFTGEGPWTFVYRRNGVNQPAITTNDNPYTLIVTQPGAYTLASVFTPPGTCTGTVSGVANVTQSNLSANITAINSTCDQSNGNVALTPTGGNPPYEFEWSNGETTEDLANVPAGTYTVTVTDEDGCTVTRTATVTNTNPPINVNGNVVANTACGTGNGNGSITLTVTPAGSYSFDWSNGTDTQNQTGLDPGSYTVTVTLVGSCTAVSSFNVPDNPNNPNLTATVTPTTCDQSNGSINASVSGGVSPFTYEWSSGETTQDLSNIPAGSYTLTVTGANGCTDELEVDVPNNNPTINVNGNVQANTACSSGNGSITLTVTPAGSYTFEWSNGSTNQNQTNLDPGTYTVTVQGPGSCTAEADFTVNDNPNNPNLTATTTPSTCDQSNGSINASVSGGVSPYTYEWSSGETTQDLTNVPAGSYTLTVTGANGCTDELEVDLGNNNPPININGNTVDNTACSSGNGSINISVTPAGSYTYEWSNGSTNQNQTNLEPGTYTVTVQGAGSCTAEESFTIDDNPNPPNLSYTTTESTCDLSNGGINLSVAGGVSPYTYTWSSGQTTQDLQNVPAGSYSVTVTGANGCTAEENIQIDNDNPPININGSVNNNTTCTGGNGSIQIFVSPGGSYTYEWSSGQTTQNINNLSPGTYTVTVQGPGSCTAEADFEVEDDPNLPNIDLDPSEASCDLPNGDINATVFGGQSPYTYQWSSGQTTQDLTNVPAGDYTLVVTGANGCTAEEETSIFNDNPFIEIDADINPNTTCIGGNGSIFTDVDPNGTYTYSWSTGATTPNLTNIPAGTYSLTVSLGGSCTAEADFTVEDEPNLPEIEEDITPSECGLSNGAIQLSVFGATTPYTYQWSNGQTIRNISNLLSGSYEVTVTGANGCSTIASFFVEDEQIPIGVFGDVTNSNSCTTGNGSILLFVDPTNSVVEWADNGSNSKIRNNLPPGDYVVNVTFGLTCTDFGFFTVEDESEIPDIVASETSATCGQTNGEIDLDIPNSFPPFTYIWSTGATTEDLYDLEPGDYEVTVTSPSTGCSATANITVFDNDQPISLSGTANPVTSCTTPNGNITLNVSPPESYTYRWSNGATTKNISNLPPGAYSVTVTLGTTCSATTSFVITDASVAPNLSAAGTPASCTLPNGSATATASGGVSPYIYRWSTNATTQTINNVAPGNYTVTVTGANGCTATATTNVANNDIALNITGVVTENTSCTSGNGALNISVAPAGGTYTYQWSNTRTTEDISGLAEGSYTVTVSAGGSCTNAATFVVTSNTSDPVISPNVTAAICGDDNGAIDLTVAGATTPYTYQWSNTAATQDLLNILSGNYTVTVTGSNGCTATGTFNVANNSDLFSLAGQASPLTRCGTPNGSVDLVITPAGPTYGISWSNSATTEDLVSLSAGTYTVTVSLTGSSCTGLASFVVEDQTTFPAASASVTPEVCGLGNGAVNLNATGGTTPYTYDWASGQTTQNLSNIASGAYTVTVTGANGCTTTASANVPDNSISFSLSGSTTPNTSCVSPNGGITLNVTPSGTYTFVWSGGQTSQNLSPAAGGSYDVTVSAGGTCTNTASFTVPDNSGAPLVSGSISAALCGRANGSIDLNVSGGLQPYIFRWSPNGTSEDLSNILSGNYAVTVTDANGCAAVNSFTVPENSFSPSLTSTITKNTNCIGGNGGVSVSVSPSDTYTYIWSGGQTAPSISNQLPGSYTVTVSAGGACTSEATYVIPDDPALPNIVENVTPSLCSQPNGAIDLTVTGAATPYVFAWSNGRTTQNISGILAGTYTVTVTAANGCTRTASFNVANNANNFNISGSPSANTFCVGSNGSINVTISPTATYTYVWSTGAITEDVNGLAPGTYTVTVTDASLCAASATYTVGNNPNAPQIDGTATDIRCFGDANGTINILLTGGTAPFVFNWSPNLPGNPQNPINLQAGNYAVTVTDAANCSSTASFSITQPASAVQIQCAQVEPVSQPGFTDGKASVTIAGGTAPFTVTWSPGGTQAGLPGGVFPLDNLAFGPYAVTVVDANGCPEVCTFNVGLLNCNTAVGTMSGNALSLCGTGCLTASYNSAGQFLDANDVQQFILHEGSGGQIVNEIARSPQPTFCFNPATMQFGKTYYISAVAGNNDGTGNVDLSFWCTAISLGTPIVFNEKPSVSAAQPEAITCAQVEVTIVGTADLPNSTFQWTTVNGQIVGNAAQAAITANKAGLYTLVIAANGCGDTTAVTVEDIRNEPLANIVANPSDILDCKISEILLSGVIEGTNDANTIWLSNGQVFANGTVVPIDAPGTYTFIILDTLTFCADTTQIFVDEDLEYPPLNINPPGQLTCTNPSVTLTGGSPFPGITLRWATIVGTDTTIVGNGPTLTVSAPNTYYLFGLDPINNCKNAETVTVSANQTRPEAEAGPSFTLPCFGGQGFLDGSGSTGTSVIVFQWTTADGLIVAGGNTPTPEIGEPGTYVLLVTQPGNGCTDTDEVYIAPEVPIPALTLRQPPCVGDRGSIRIDSVIGGKPPFQYSLDTGATFVQSGFFQNLTPGVYSILVIDSEGCSATTSAEVLAPEIFEISLETEALIRVGESYLLKVEPTVPPAQIASVLWTPSVGLECDTCLETLAMPFYTTRYNVEVQSVNGCEDRASLLLRVDRDVAVYVPNVFSPDGDNYNDVFYIFADPKAVIGIKSFLVFNRWGEMVHEYYNFQPNDPASGWNGNFRDQPLNPAVFVWYAELEFVDGRTEFFKGDVTLKR